jgi:proline iminopeptidase
MAGAALTMDRPMSHAWQVLHPPVQPHDGGWLPVLDGHAVHWTVAGHPAAPAVLFVHGGPGAGCKADDRRWFDPAHWRIVCMDQRACGLSAAEDPLHANDTWQLVADIERLRQHLGIARWCLFGGSWGGTLALAVAQHAPQHVSGLVLRGVFTGTAAETARLYGPRGAALHHPAAWERLCAAAGNPGGGRLLDALQVRLAGEGAQAQAAAQAWAAWEPDLMDAETTAPAPPRAPIEPGIALRQARIGVHYARAGWFLAEGQLLNQAHRLRGIPGVIVQGQRDRVTPPAAAQALQAVWPQSRLHTVAAAGHSSQHPATAQALVAAVAEMASAARRQAGLSSRRQDLELLR